MRKQLAIATLSMILSVPVTFAAEQGSKAKQVSEQEAHHPEGQESVEGGLGTAGGGMMGGMPMHQQMQAMREQMQKIHATEDPQERHKLMQEHRQSMHDMMKMMHGMMAGQSMMGDCPMMGPGMMGGGQPGMMMGGQLGMMMGGQPGMMGGGQQGTMSDRQAMMDRRMNMMAERMNMMQMMMEHQDAATESLNVMKRPMGKGPMSQVPTGKGK